MGKRLEQVHQKRGHSREFPGGPVVRTQHFHCQGPVSIPGGGTKIPSAMPHGQKKKTIVHFIAHILVSILKIKLKPYRKHHPKKKNIRIIPLEIRSVLVNPGCHNKIIETGWLKQQLFLTVLEAEKFKIKVLTDSVPVKTLFLACRWLPSHCVLTRRRGKPGLSSSSNKYTNPIMKAPPL